MARDAAAAALLDFELGEMVQVLAEGPPLALGLLRDLLGVARERGELERAQENRERLERTLEIRHEMAGWKVRDFSAIREFKHTMPV